MQLSEKDVELYYELMRVLQSYVNQELKLYPEIKDEIDIKYAEIEEKAAIRNALYENIGLIDSFIKKNPEKFSNEELSIIAGWKNFIGGDFYVERFLKKFSIFIQDETVYAVLGLQQPLSDLIPKSRLPLYIKTYLLPFKGKIIYDGLFGSANFYFGGGIKGSLKD